MIREDPSALATKLIYAAQSGGNRREGYKTKQTGTRNKEKGVNKVLETKDNDNAERIERALGGYL